MASIIIKKDSVKQINDKLINSIADKSIRTEDKVWVFPGGEREKLKTYFVNSDLGILAAGFGHKWETRFSHFFTLSTDKEKLSPDVELNIPFKHSRKISGLYYENNDEIWIGSRGLFTAFRQRIKKDVTLSFFSKSLINIDDVNQTSTIIEIAEINSDYLPNQIAYFIKELIQLKQLAKTEQYESQITKSENWNMGFEFEGFKKGHSPNTEIDYEYLHGPICNRLKRLLEKYYLKHKNIKVKRNKHIDVALVENNNASHIFEIKTSSSLSDQIYKGIGQLLLYQLKYGDKNTLLTLVTVKDDEKINRTINNLLNQLGIDVLFFNKAHFEDIKGNIFLE